jgi:Bacterial pre-peptidase C-terminal domain
MALMSFLARCSFAATFALALSGCATTTPISDGDGSGGDGSGGDGSTSTGSKPATTATASTGSGSTCGDSVCASFETCVSCPDDCGACGPACGDGVCDSSEDCTSCPDDCGTCSVCGDGTCSPDEDCKSCYQDCGICACMPDTFEPNNNSPAATPVASGTDYCDLSICAGDYDWFEFNVVNGFTATATFHEGQGDLDLEIYNGQTLAYVTGSYSSDDNESVSISVSAGTYWARVYGKGGAVNPDYCFRVDTN